MRALCGILGAVAVLAGLAFMVQALTFLPMYISPATANTGANAIVLATNRIQVYTSLAIPCFIFGALMQLVIMGSLFAERESTPTKDYTRPIIGVEDNRFSSATESPEERSKKFSNLGKL